MRSLQASGWGEVDNQSFTLYHILGFLKRIDRLGAQIVRLLFSKDPEKGGPRTIVIEGRIRDVEITLY
ncbi:hypothetical protein HRbin01_01422 [archaeon HR01]|nr:hypothetical protein HRbin01_01422 [archaeon HR01]